MNAQNGPLRVAAVGDLHAHALPAGAHRGLFADIAEQADVVILCGDLTNIGLPEEAHSLAADLLTVRLPVAAVLGNHDHHSGKGAEVKAILQGANVHFLDDDAFEHQGVGFAGVKGFGGGFGGHMLNAFGEEATKHFVTEAVNEALNLENALKSLGAKRKVVALHYAPVADTVRGESPEIYPFLGCARLAETIDRFEVAAVFHGHAHHGMARGKTPRGTPVYNCCVEVLKRDGGTPFVIVEV
jgi:uncharacterized protein